MLRLLYVDDDPDVREVAMLSLALDPALDLRAAESGREALAIAAVWRPDIILLDVMMPEMDGPATLAALRAMPDLGDPRVIFITARAQQHERDSLLDLGVCGMIAKPFDPMTLAASARALAGLA